MASHIYNQKQMYLISNSFEWCFSDHMEHLKMQESRNLTQLWLRCHCNQALSAFNFFGTTQASILQLQIVRSRSLVAEHSSIQYTSLTQETQQLDILSRKCSHSNALPSTPQIKTVTGMTYKCKRLNQNKLEIL